MTPIVTKGQVIAGLFRVRKLIVDGWGQGEYRTPKVVIDGDGRRTQTCYCAMGAVDHVSQRTVGVTLAFSNTALYAGMMTSLARALPKHLQPAVPTVYCRVAVINFNDSARTTQRDVVRLIDRAISQTRRHGVVEVQW